MQFSSNRYPFLTVKIKSGKDLVTPNGTLRVVERPKSIQFNQGTFITNDREVIELLLNHPAYNMDFYGPFSRDEVSSGEYLQTLNNHIKLSDADRRKFDVKKIAAEGAENSKTPDVIRAEVSPNLTKESIRLEASKILAEELAKNKKG